MKEIDAKTNAKVHINGSSGIEALVEFYEHVSSEKTVGAKYKVKITYNSLSLEKQGVVRTLGFNKTRSGWTSIIMKLVDEKTNYYITTQDERLRQQVENYYAWKKQQ